MGTMMASYWCVPGLRLTALPLGLAIILHMLSTRGSRESLSSRLSHKGQGSLIVLLLILLVSSAFLVGHGCRPEILCSVSHWCGGCRASLDRYCSRGWAIGLMALLLASVGLGAATEYHLAGRRGRPTSCRFRVLGEGPAPLDRQPDDLSQLSRSSAQASAASARFIPT